MKGEKSAEISQKHCNTRMNPNDDYGFKTSHTLHSFVIFSLLYSYYVTGMIKNWNCVYW